MLDSTSLSSIRGHEIAEVAGLITARETAASINTSSSVFTSTNTEDNAAAQDIDVLSHTAAKTVCKLSETEMSRFILERPFAMPS